MVDVSNEILDAIEIIIDAKIRENTAQIYSGVCKGISGNTCVMSINGRNNTVQFYGSTPTVGSTYRVFVPNGNMSIAFIITGTNDGSGGSSGVTSYTKLTDLPTINGVVLQEGATSKSLSLYGIGNEPNYPVTKVNGKTGEVILTADDVDALPSSTTIVNPNLLDNWYFANPVNQRGQTEYTAGGYTIDRWKLEENGSVKSALVVSSGIALNNGDDTTYCNFAQIVEKLPAGTYIVSFLVDDFSNVNQVFCTAINKSSFTFNSNVVSLKFTLDADSDSVKIGIQKKLSGNALTVKAAKLELGSQQTLAHQDADGNWVLNEIPDYGEQLRRCQRYFVNFNPYKVNWFAMPPAVASGPYQAYSAVTLPVAMRTQPTVTYGGKIVLSQASDYTVTAIMVSGDAFTGNSIQLRYDVGAGGLTANSMYRVQGGNDSTSYIWLSADL